MVKASPCVPTMVPMMPRRFEIEPAASWLRQAITAVIEKKCAMSWTGALCTVLR